MFRFFQTADAKILTYLFKKVPKRWTTFILN